MTSIRENRESKTNSRDKDLKLRGVAEQLPSAESIDPSEHDLEFELATVVGGDGGGIVTGGYIFPTGITGEERESRGSSNQFYLRQDAHGGDSL